MTTLKLTTGLGPARLDSDDEPSESRKRVRRARRRLGPGPRIPYGVVIGPLALLLAWTLGSATGLLDPRVLSEPWTVVQTFGRLIAEGRLQDNLLTSGLRAVTGLAAGLLVGGTAGVLSGLSRGGEAVIDGPIQAKRATPTLALIPLLILWFGIGEQMKVIAIAIGVSVQIYLHTHAGLRAIDARYVELAETLRLDKWTFIRKVALPGALPQFLIGLRHGVTTAWLVLVAVEQINATSGIGHMMSLARSYGQTEIIVVGLLVYGAFGLVSDTAVRLLERKVLTWRRSLAH